MPHYRYRCNSKVCANEWLEFQAMKDSLIEECPKCGSKDVTRLIGAGSGVVYKGTGFYCTDNPKKEAGHGSKKK